MATTLIIILCSLVVFGVIMVLLVNWLTHLQMNKGGKYVSYKTIIKLVSSCPYIWERHKAWKTESAFIQKPIENDSEYWRDYNNWYLHADVIILDGNKYKLFPISYFRFKHYLKSMNLSYRKVL